VRIAIIAGESSGDLLGAGLLRALRGRGSDLQIEGIGGPHMRDAGCVSLYPMDRLSVIGLFESFGRYPELLPVRARLIKRFLASRPDVFIGVDAPDFNLGVASKLRRAGIRTAHFVSPSVWAWRRYRLRKIARSIDRMLVLFPFEAKFYREHNIGVEFVGHPLADAISGDAGTAVARRALGLDADAEIVALLPGSRMSEVAQLARPMVRTAVWLARQRPGVRFAAPIADPGLRRRFAAELVGEAARIDLEIFEGRSREVMSASDVVLLASGTASLEAMLLKRPMVITYRTTVLSYLILRSWVGANISHVGLPNLLAGRPLVPELLQGDAVPEKLGAAVLQFLQRPEAVAMMCAEFDRIGQTLRCDAAERAADAVLDLCH